MLDTTVKLRYNGLAYNVFSVTAYISSWSRHFSIQNVSVIMYFGIMYPRLLQTNFGPKPCNGPGLVRTFARRLRSWLQSIACRQSPWHFDAIGMSPGVRSGGTDCC